MLWCSGSSDTSHTLLRVQRGQPEWTPVRDNLWTLPKVPPTVATPLSGCVYSAAVCLLCREARRAAPGAWRHDMVQWTRSADRKRPYKFTAESQAAQPPSCGQLNELLDYNRQGGASLNMATTLIKRGLVRSFSYTLHTPETYIRQEPTPTAASRIDRHYCDF